MKRDPVKLKLYGPTGDEETWTVIFGTPTNPKDDGECLWGPKKIVINKRLRSKKKIRHTLYHEIGHATAGQNASEEFIINLEVNIGRVDDRFSDLLQGD